MILPLIYMHGGNPMPNRQLKSAKILAIVVIWDQTAKLNYHQLYYGISY